MAVVSSVVASHYQHQRRDVHAEEAMCCGQRRRSHFSSTAAAVEEAESVPPANGMMWVALTFPTPAAAVPCASPRQQFEAVRQAVQIQLVSAPTHFVPTLVQNPFLTTLFAQPTPWAERLWLE
jgi:hypothetical protein